MLLAWCFNNASLTTLGQKPALLSQSLCAFVSVLIMAFAIQLYLISSLKFLL